MEHYEKLKEEFQQKKKEVVLFRAKLHVLHKEKEELFNQVKSSHDSIKLKTTRMKVIKKERDQLTREVKELKEERNKLNKEVQEKSKTLQDIAEKGDTPKKTEHESPGKLRSIIRNLEEKLETEVMAFTKEQQLTKKIKEIKSELKQIEGFENAWKEKKSAVIEFSQKRKAAQQSHQTVQQKADESQKKHEELTQLYKDVKEAREKIKPLDDKIKGLKSKYNATKKEVDKVSNRVKELSKLFEDKDKKMRQNKAQVRTAEVKEKLKKKQKLSTEDILAFQALDE